MILKKYLFNILNRFYINKLEKSSYRCGTIVNSISAYNSGTTRTTSGEFVVQARDIDAAYSLCCLRDSTRRDAISNKNPSSLLVSTGHSFGKRNGPVPNHFDGYCRNRLRRSHGILKRRVRFQSGGDRYSDVIGSRFV